MYRLWGKSQISHQLDRPGSLFILIISSILARVSVFIVYSLVYTINYVKHLGRPSPEEDLKAYSRVHDADPHLGRQPRCRQPQLGHARYGPGIKALFWQDFLKDALERSHRVGVEGWCRLGNPAA